jgi:hypothetical protein
MCALVAAGVILCGLGIGLAAYQAQKRHAGQPSAEELVAMRRSKRASSREAEFDQFDSRDDTGAPASLVFSVCENAVCYFDGAGGCVCVMVCGGAPCCCRGGGR